MREGRRCFNPCLFNAYVYLCGSGSLSLEAFAPQTDSFLPLQPQLPESSNCCLFVHNNLLVVHSQSYISKFAADRAEQLVQRSQVRSQKPANKHSNSQPVVDSALGLFFIIQKGQVLGFNIETSVICSASRKLT